MFYSFKRIEKKMLHICTLRLPLKFHTNNDWCTWRYVMIISSKNINRYDKAIFTIYYILHTYVHTKYQIIISIFEFILFLKFFSDFIDVCIWYSSSNAAHHHIIWICPHVYRILVKSFNSEKFILKKKKAESLVWIDCNVCNLKIFWKSQKTFYWI